jgi:hypothetical protein
MLIEIEGLRWGFWMAPNLTVEERGQAGHAISLALIDPPRTKKELLRVAIRTLLHLFEGSMYGRAKLLEQEYLNYLANGWKREGGLESLPYPRSTLRACLHRLARLNGGRELRRRQIDRIAGPL